MARTHRVRFARLAAVISLTAIVTLPLTAAAVAKPAIPAVHSLAAVSPASHATADARGGIHGSTAVPTPSPQRTPSPEPGPIARPTGTSGGLLPVGPSLPAVLAVLAVAACAAGIGLMSSRGRVRSGRGRVRGQHSTVGRVTESPRTRGPLGRAA